MATLQGCQADLGIPEVMNALLLWLDHELPTAQHSALVPFLSPKAWGRGTCLAPLRSIWELERRATRLSERAAPPYMNSNDQRAVMLIV